MKKRILSMLLAVVLLVGLLPMKAEASCSTEDKAVIQSAVEKLLQDHAKKVYQSNAADDAFTDFFVHAIFGNHKDMYLTDSSAQTAALFNSNLMQYGLSKAMTEALIAAYETHEETVTGRGSVSWLNFKYSYGFVSYSGDENYHRHYAEKPDTSARLKSLCNVNQYSGPSNRNDEVQELLSGGLWVRFLITRTEVKGDAAVYRIDLKLQDDFDFEGDYNDLAKRGYDTSKDNRLKKLGLLMTTMGIDEFYWEYTKSFTIEVPYHCDHERTAYQWSYDGETRSLTSNAVDGFAENETEALTYLHEYTDSEGGEKQLTRYYCSLEDTVILEHDQPWVIERDWSGGRSLQLSHNDSLSGSVGTFYFFGYYNIWMYFEEDVYLPEGEKTSTGNNRYYIYHYVGLSIQDQFEYSPQYHYTTRLENVVNEDGTNMIYASIYNHDLDEVVFGPEAMDDHWTKQVEGERSLVSEADPILSGRDFYVNYIGTKNVGLPQGANFELRIDENGEAVGTESTVAPVYDAPTCTEQGGTVHTCRDCGYSYTTDVVSATGHTYGEYAYNNNATCTADGTQTRKCTVCGETETVTASGTALGHSYDAVVTEPTLTEQGYTTYTCTRCGDSYKDDYTDKKEHKYVPEVTEPTCIAEGYTTYTCSECGDSYVDDYTDMVEHTPVIDPAAAPTCVEKGKTEGSHCGVCGYVIKKQANISTVDRHNYTEEITKVPTYEEAGEVTYTCKNCGKVEIKTIPAFVKPTPKNPFTDVSENDWFYEPVLWAVDEGVTGGKTETTFAPNEGCTRAQVVTFLWAANGKPEPKSMDNPFDDVASDAWYLKPVLWAVEQGITTGISETAFGPEQTCTRAQIATFLWAANGKHAVSSESTFSDVTGAEWYATPVIWAVENDVTSGIGNGKFGPNDTCTRAQVVTFLKKVYGDK